MITYLVSNFTQFSETIVVFECRLEDIPSTHMGVFAFISAMFCLKTFGHVLITLLIATNMNIRINYWLTIKRGEKLHFEPSFPLKPPSKVWNPIRVPVGKKNKDFSSNTSTLWTLQDFNPSSDSSSGSLQMDRTSKRGSFVKVQTHNYKRIYTSGPRWVKGPVWCRRTKE